MAAKTVLILGGGTGGLVAANRLRRLLAGEHRVVLVSRSYVYSFAPSYTWVMLGRRTGRRISRDLRTLQQKGIEFVQGEVEAIDTERKRVRVGERELKYDYLMVALGAQYSADEIEGLGRTWTYYHLEGADGLQEELPRVSGGRIAIVVSGLPYKCPPAPYEGAFLLDDYFRRRKLRDAIEIRVFTPEPRPLRLAGEEVSGRLEEMLSQRGISFMGGAQLSSVDHEHKLLHFADGGTAPWDTVIATPVHRAPDVLVRSGLAPAGGWVAVDRETLATAAAEDVYAIGDCTTVPLGDGLALPKAGVFAHGEAEVVARNISAEISEGEPIWAYGGQGACFLETDGSHGSYISGHFFADPAPHVTMRHPSRIWHWAKVGFERLWLWRWF